MVVTRPMLARLTPHAPNDPGLSSLRRAARAAIVIPSAFSFATFVVRDVQFTTFVAFGCFALLVMADFGGPRQSRVAAYVMATFIGAALVAVGTLVSPIAWAAVLAMTIIGFWIQFAGVFGGYLAASQTALLLSFVLSVSVSASPGEVGPRVAGWFFAGIISSVSGAWLWPRFERNRLRSKAAEACRALAGLITVQREAREQSASVAEYEAARVAVEEVRRLYTASPKRPAGPARRDRAFVELLTELERTLEFTTLSLGTQTSSTHPCITEGRQLSLAVAQTLDASAGALLGGSPPDLLGLNESRSAHREALNSWAAASLRSGISPEDVLRGLDADHGLRVISYLALAIGANATIAGGGRPEDSVSLPVASPRKGASRTMNRIAGVIRTHLTPRSSVLHQSVRVGIALALAVVLARVLRLEHAFWVVLGTLSVLRSNALNGKDDSGSAAWHAPRLRGRISRHYHCRRHISRPVGGIADRCISCDVCRRSHRFRRGTSSVYRARDNPLQPHCASGVAGGIGPNRGYRCGCRGQYCDRAPRVASGGASRVRNRGCRVVSRRSRISRRLVRSRPATPLVGRYRTGEKTCCPGSRSRG